MSAFTSAHNGPWWQSEVIDPDRHGAIIVLEREAGLEDYIDYCKTLKRTKGTSPLDDATFRYQLANLRVEIETLRMIAYRVGWMQSRGEVPQKESSMSKLWADIQFQKTYKTLARGLGDFLSQGFAITAIELNQLGNR